MLSWGLPQRMRRINSRSVPSPPRSSPHQHRLFLVHIRNHIIPKPAHPIPCPVVDPQAQGMLQWLNLIARKHSVRIEDILKPVHVRRHHANQFGRMRAFTRGSGPVKEVRSPALVLRRRNAKREQQLFGLQDEGRNRQSQPALQIQEDAVAAALHLA